MKLPKKAKRVFKGEIFDVYQWNQKMFDGSYKIFEFVKRQDTVIIIPSYKGKIIALKQRQPHTKWFICTPSGRMDVEGEKPLNTAKRELLEETGMKSNAWKLWKKIEKKGKVKNYIYIYTAQNCFKVGPQQLDNGEKIIVKLISFSQFLRLSDKSTPYMAETVEDMLRARLNKKFCAKYKKAIFGS